MCLFAFFSALFNFFFPDRPIYLKHYFSYASESIKIGLAQSLFLRAYRICDQDFLTKEIDHVKRALSKLAYPEKILNKALKRQKRPIFPLVKK